MISAITRVACSGRGEPDSPLRPSRTGDFAFCATARNPNRHLINVVCPKSETSRVKIPGLRTNLVSPGGVREVVRSHCTRWAPADMRDEPTNLGARNINGEWSRAAANREATSSFTGASEWVKIPLLPPLYSAGDRVNLSVSTCTSRCQPNPILFERGGDFHAEPSLNPTPKSASSAGPLNSSMSRGSKSRTAIPSQSPAREPARAQWPFRWQSRTRPWMPVIATSLEFSR